MMRFVAAFLALLLSAGTALAQSIAGSGGNLGLNTTIYDTHAHLIAGVTAAPSGAWTLQQQGFLAAGDGGSATYAWNATSTCPTGMSTSGDSIVCILPSGQAAGTPGRYLLQVGATLDVRSVGILPGGQDNYPYVQALMTAIGPANLPFLGGSEVVFPAIPGQQYTVYYFSKPLVLARNATYHCANGGHAQGAVDLVFPAGVDGVIQEDTVLTPDFGEGGGALTNCRISSSGFSTATATQNSATITNASFTPSHAPAPAPAWHIGDGIVLTSAKPGDLTYPAILEVLPGAYLSNVSGSTLTLASPYTTGPLMFGYASAYFQETSTNNFVSGDTIQVGNNTFTAVNPVGVTQCSFLVGANWAASVANLVAAVNVAAGDGTTYNHCTVAPNVTAAVYTIPYGTATSQGKNAISFNSTALGTASNSYVSVYVPAGTPAGAFGAATFSHGSASGNNSMYAWQLPVADVFSIATVAGSLVALEISGPRDLVGGDIIWSDAFPFGTTALWNYPSTFFTQTGSNNFSAGDTFQTGNDTFTFVSPLGSTPGNVLLGANWAASAANLQAAINRAAGAGSTYVTASTTRNTWVQSITGNTIVIRDNIFGLSYAIPGFPAASSYPTVYTAQGAPAGSFAGATLLPAILMDDTFMQGDQQGATVSHPPGSPGQLWVMPAGLKRDTQASARENYYRGFPFGMEMPCSTGSIGNFNCTGSYDEANVSSNGLVGRWVSGSNTGASTSVSEEGQQNTLADLFEGGPVGSVYMNYQSASTDAGLSLYGVLGNCSSVNESVMLGGLLNSGNGACAAAISLLPTTNNSNMLFVGPQYGYGPGGAPTISRGVAIGQWIFDTNNTTGAFPALCINNGNNVLTFANDTSCATHLAWGLSRNTTLNSFDESFAGSALMRYVATADGYTGYAGEGTVGIEFARGVLLYNTEDWNNAPTNARMFSEGSSIPVGTWHKKGDVQFNSNPSNNIIGWVDTADGANFVPFGAIGGLSGSIVASGTCTLTIVNGTITGKTGC
jgi:hypothetical protein